MTAPVLCIDEGGGVRRISLNRPDRLNAMNRALIDAVAEAFEAAQADPSVRAIVFSGEGRAFCAGDDRRDHTHPQTEAEARDLVEAIQRVTRAICLGPKPVVGAVHGWAVGGGLEWAINCDFPIWAEGAQGFFPEISLGIFVTGGVTALLPALAGLQKAREMLYLGQRYGAAELAASGVAWRVVPDAALMAEAITVARRLAALPPRAVADMKRALCAVGAAGLDRALDIETEATVAGFLDPETTRRIRDFGGA